jgi:hypothetical protein
MIDVATRPGALLDFPEHPYKGRAQADDNAQEDKSQAWDCEHGEHPSTNARNQCNKRMQAAYQQMATEQRLGAGYTGAAGFLPPFRDPSTLFDRAWRRPTS